jgi:hypothetical protein
MLLPRDGRSIRVEVTTTPGCAWTARSTLGWIQVTGPATGRGAGSVEIELSPNAGSDRMGLVLIGASRLLIVQRGAGIERGHPRLWLRASDLDRMRRRARPDNPLWAKVIRPRTEQALHRYDTVHFPNGRPAQVWPGEDTDTALQLAFYSLVAPDPAARADAARKGRDLFVRILQELDRRGAGTRDEKYPVTDAFRYTGEHWGLLTDWLYPALSSQDRALARRVLLRFAERHAEHSAWMRKRGVVSDFSLVKDRSVLRWVANNWTTAMARNLLLESLAIDEEDDPPINAGQPPLALRNSLRAYREEALRALLYMQYHLFRPGGDASGGVPPEGAYGYGAEATAFLFQGLLGLLTAGYVDWDAHGEQVTMAADRYLHDLVTYYVHGMAPTPEGREPGYRVATSEQTRVPSTGGYLQVAQLTPVGLIAAQLGDPVLRDRVRWILDESLAGGRAKREEHFRYSASHAILSFLLHEPALPPSRDFRPALPRTFHAPAVGRVSSRTGWDAEARWFHYTCSWKTIDHQIELCGSFMFWRKGDWITDPRNGYSDTGLIDAPDYWNAMAIQKPGTVNTFDALVWSRGGETRFNMGQPRTIVFDHPEVLYVESDATNLHNRTEPLIDEVRLAQRAILWRRPDVLVIYDRVTTAAPGGFKRFWLNLPGNPVIEGRTVRARTRGGQRVRLDSLLPPQVMIARGPWEDDPGAGTEEQMVAHVRIEDPRKPADVRMLHVLQASDPDTPEATPVSVATRGPAFHGIRFEGTMVFFSVAPPPQSGEGLAFAVPAEIDLIVVTGLPPGALYDLVHGGPEAQLRVGSGHVVDQSGVLVVPAGRNRPQ